MKKRFIAVLLALCLLAGLFPMTAEPARAENFTVYVTDNTLKVYAKVSTSSSVLGTMSYGESMTCLATNSSWAAVRNSAGRIGYCKISGLSVANPNTLNKTAYVAVANTPVYRKPDVSSGVMMYLKKNSSYAAVAMTADKQWVRLQNGKYYGYVKAANLSTSVESDPEDTQLPTSTTVYIIANTLKAYDRASTSGKSLGTMSFGESMTLLSTSGEWARIRNSSGATGYCKLSGLSTANPNTLNQKIYITADGVKVYRKPDTSAGVMMYLKKNSSYTCVAVTADGSWVRLQNGKYYGYVQAKYVSNLEIPEEDEEDVFLEQTVYVSSNTLPVYKTASESAAKLGTMSFGEALTLINVDDGWAQVRNSSGAVGYCLYGGLTRTNPNSLQQTLYAARDGVKLYSKPLTSASVTRTVSLNTALAVIALSEDGDWARINLGGSYAYAQMEQLSQSKHAQDNAAIQDVTPRTVYISSTTLVCYASNSTSSSALGTMSFGESLTCTGEGEGWARVVNSSGKVGYCKLSGLTDTNPNTGNVTMYAQSSGVKVYEKASTSSSVLSTLSLNSKVTAVAASSDKTWLRLKSGSFYGYAQSKHFATSMVESDTNSSTMSKIVALAKAQIGIKYVYAAQSPSSGFDCSGFTYYVYKNAAGITLKRTAYTQGYNNSYTKITNRKDLKVGDLVFFNTVDDGGDDLCDHVGIYIGNNEFIHASSAAGKVTISSLGTSSSSYYYRTFSWGRRILS